MSDLSWSQIARRFAAALRQPMGRAIAVAAGLTLALAIAVLAVWSVDPGAGGDEATTLSATLLSPAAGDAGPTPTPRVVATRPPRTATAAAAEQADAAMAGAAPTAPPPTPTRTAPAPTAQAPAVPTPAQTSTAPNPAIAPPPAAATRPTATALPRAIAPAGAAARPRATGTPALEPLYVAEDGDALAAWASGAWSIVQGQLVHEVVSNNAARWIVGPFSPDDDDYAVEAEVRVLDFDPSVQCQTFGLVSVANGVARGAGVGLPCQGTGARARLADVTAWSNGYFLTPDLDTATFDPGDEWHLYRFEVQGSDLRFLIDGEEVAAAAAPAGVGAGDAEIGLWSQGVGLGVRRVAVLPLDAETAG